MERFIEGIKCTIIREIYSSNNYRTFACLLDNPKDESKISLNKYGNFTISGDLSFLKNGESYTLDLKQVNHPRYGLQYMVEKVKDYEIVKDLEELTIEQSMEILTKFTTETQANTLLTVYPNFIAMVINGKTEEIDVKKLKNIKEYRLNCYIREINTRFKYYYILIHHKNYDLTIGECQELDNVYGSVEAVEEAINKEPYSVLIDVLHRDFLRTDKLLMKIRPELKESANRIEHIALHILNLNEEDDNTYMDANTMAGFCAEIDKDCIPHIKKTCVESQKIWYDDATKRIAKADTYIAESTIADFFIDILCTPGPAWNFEWKKYTKIKDGTLTDEQSELLHVVCENRVAVLNAGAGCVDSETEYFNGKEWKSIAQYIPEEKVLQYNVDGTAELVKPLRYIKLPCNEMYHFETKYGLNQTLSEEHVIPYIYSDRGKQQLKFTTMLDLKNKHETNERGFRGKFITSFRYDGKGIDLTDNEIKIMCAVICDGTFTHSNTTLCRFHIKKQRKKDNLRNLFKESNLQWREKESAAEGYTDFYIYAPRKEKEFLSYWYNCTQKQLQIVCDNILQWDGSIIGNRKTFSTTVLSTANFIQFAFSACDYKASLKEKNRIGRIRKINNKEYVTKSTEYELAITTRNLLTITKDSRPTHKKQTEIIKVKSIDGFKYCFEVETGMLVLRRKNNIFITGNCGKTSSMMALINMLEDNGKTYSLFAPTGRAAKRLAEQTHRKASTVHKGCSQAQADGGIDSDVIICDEWSMYGLEHMMMLVKACSNPDVRFVFSGDIHQLPSIALGCVMRDFIESNIIPVITLTKVFRYKEGGLSAIVNDIYNKLSIHEKLNFEDGVKCVLGINKDYTFIKSNGTTEQILDTYMEKINQGIKPIDIAVITPWNVKEFGTYRINNLIQSAINPARKNERVIERDVKDCTITFRKGDIVMNTKNNYTVPTYETYKRILEETGEVDLSLARETVGVFNGDIGKILDIDANNVLIIQFDENMVVFKGDDCNSLVLGYAGTIHKYQGSQCPHIIFLSLKCHERSFNNNLLYTGISRASQETTQIGDLSTVENCIAIDGNENRQTQLKDFLLKSYELKTSQKEIMNNEETEDDTFWTAV